MEIETNIISAETIKPSSPTPKSLHKHHLSFLDQISPLLFCPMVYFYPSNPQISNSEKSKQLKKSLSEVLSIYYPLAGRLVGNLYVDCNDAGAPFFEAQADCYLSQVVTNQSPKNLIKLLPYRADETEDPCMAIVQATYFRCGGLAVGLLISHKIVDAISFVLFAKTWSAVARNSGGIPLPKFDAAAYFPPLDIPGLQFTSGITKEEVAARIFTFPPSKIASLRERYTTGGRCPSRVEALSAFIWTHFVSSTGVRSDPDKICTVYNAVNLRSRAEPPLSEYHFGNIVSGSMAKVAAGDGGVALLQKMWEALKDMDGGHVARLKNGEQHLKEMMAQAQAQAHEAEPVRFIFTSLSGLPLYEADFGWGKPVRVVVGPTSFPYKNTVVFMDTKSGGGIEALISLTKQDMEKFEAHLELPMLNSSL